jgi:hypothetical protein
MFYRKGEHVNSLHLKGNASLYGTKFQSGESSSLLFGMKNIGKPLPKFLEGMFCSIYRDRLFPAEGTYIIQAVEMVCMGMGKKHGIQMIDPFPYGLKPKFGSRIYDER